ncbi:MAG: hypothetical protein C0501_30570 [Isosphaera sp.]|nr:hypothetical protein [Isosphaera sp.]
MLDEVLTVAEAVAVANARFGANWRRVVVNNWFAKGVRMPGGEVRKAPSRPTAGGTRLVPRREFEAFLDAAAAAGAIRPRVRRGWTEKGVTR